MFGSSQWMYNSGGFEIEQSLRLEKDNKSNLTYIPTTYGSRKTFTVSMWIKPSDHQHTPTSDSFIFTGGAYLDAGGQYFAIQWKTYDDTHHFLNIEHSGQGFRTLPLIRDVSSWYHIVVAIDTDHDSSDERIICYINGARIDMLGPAPDKGQELIINTPELPIYIGNINLGTIANPSFSRPYGGYIADVYFISNQQLTPDYFGEVNEGYGNWEPKEFAIDDTPKGTHDLNDFHLDFKGGTPLGDSSSTTDIFGDSSIRAFYKLDGNFNDETNNYNGTLVGTASWTTDNKFGSNAFSSTNGAAYGLLPRILDSNFTWSFWVKFDTLDNCRFFGVEGGAIDPDMVLQIYQGYFGYYAGSSIGSQYTLFRPQINRWYHIAVVSGVGVYVNGLLISKQNIQQPGSGGYIGVGVDGMDIGEMGYIDGTIDQIRIFSKACSHEEVYQLLHEGSYIPDIADDAIAGVNNFSYYNVSQNDIMKDTPSNNFCTWNSFHEQATNGNTYELTYGNLRSRASGGNGLGLNATMLIPSTGKYYFEWHCEFISASSTDYISINSEAGNQQYRAYGQIYQDSVQVVNNSAYSIDDGDTVGVVVDVDNSQVTFYKNGSAVHTVTSSQTLEGAYIRIYQARGANSYPPGDTYVANWGQDSSFAGNTTRNGYTDSRGIGDFYYPVPSGSLALCTKNLPEPAVKPQEHFKTVLYAGTEASNTVNVGFQPDFVWLKSRDIGYDHKVFDSVRGAGKRLTTNGNYIEETNTELTAFNSNGFTVLSTQANNKDGEYAAWVLKGGGAAVTNTDGTYTSQVSANVDAGFSIVTYTGTTGNQVQRTVGHGLSKAPEMVMIRNREWNSSNIGWPTWHKSLGNSMAYLDATAGSVPADYPAHFGQQPNATTFGVRYDLSIEASTNAYRANGPYNYVAYCFHSVEGFSKFGKYTGNGSIDGPFTITGFRPAFVIIKSISTGNHWTMFDSARNQWNGNNDLIMYPNLTNADSGDGMSVNFHSNGFKIVDDTSDRYNTNGYDYIYMAFAEYPFKYSNARMTSYDKITEAPAPATINQSLRFNGDDGAYLSRTFTDNTNRQTWTFSTWFKRGKVDGWQRIIEAGADTSNFCTITLKDDNETIEVMDRAGSNQVRVQAYNKVRDPAEWYHLVVTFDTSNTREADRVVIYLNGNRLDYLEFNQQPTINYAGSMNNNITHWIGRATNNTSYFDGYLADTHFVDGQALGPDHFGYKDPTYGDWRPKTYDDRNPEPNYGPNGFRLTYNSGSARIDQSGMGNHWTVNNFSESTDVVLDSPTNNFATWNKLTTNLTLREGALNALYQSNDLSTVSTIGAKTGKWYWEIRLNASTTGICYGITHEQAHRAWIPADQSMSVVGGFYGFQNSVSKKANGSGISGNMPSTSAGSIVMFALDCDNNRLWVGVDGTWMDSGNPGSNSNPTFSGLDPDRWWFPAIEMRNTSDNITANFGQDSSFAGTETSQGNSDSNGEGDFYYTTPTGFLTLCNNNLPNPTVVPQENFKVITWTGAGDQEDRSITGVGFKPDLLWTKIRTQDWYNLVYDSIRGAGANTELSTNRTFEEGGGDPDRYGYLGSFDDDGFTGVWSGQNNNDYFNRVNNTYVAWNWKAGGTAVTNNDGAIQAQVSANPDAGFSIVSYAGSQASDFTVGHGLSQTPQVVITKTRDTAANWGFYTTVLGTNTNWLVLNTNAAIGSQGGNLAGGAFVYLNSSTIQISTNAFANSGSSMIAYAFHDVPGFSKIGIYGGNGSTDGQFVYTGFQPSFVMVKSYNATQHWNTPVFSDALSYGNGSMNTLSSNLSNAERAMDQNPAVDYTSNGFKIRTSDGNYNANGSDYLYMAFAEYPFKRTNAR